MPNERGCKPCHLVISDMEEIQQTKALEIARNLLAKGIDSATVAETTGISAEDL